MGRLEAYHGDQITEFRNATAIGDLWVLTLGKLLLVLHGRILR